MSYLKLHLGPLHMLHFASSGPIRVAPLCFPVTLWGPGHSPGLMLLADEAPTPKAQASDGEKPIDCI